MPELPEVEGVVRALRPKVINKQIESVQLSETLYTSWNSGKQCIVKNIEPEKFIDMLKGARILSILRRSKYIFFHLEKNNKTYLFVNHLGMTGAWFAVNSLKEIKEEKFRKHIHCIIAFTTGELLAFSDIRRFGEMRILESIEEHPPLLQMAPEPFDKEALPFFLEKCALPKYQNKPIKEVIMDGQVISGCGNIYATEALFQMKIHPARKVNRISQKRKIELFHTICNILKESIEMGGSTISDYRNINGEAGNMQKRLKMYGKSKCPICHTNTKAIIIAGRTSTYCPKCQR